MFRMPISRSTRRVFLQALTAAGAGFAFAQAPPRVRTIAGTGVAGAGADGDEALLTALSNPYGLVIGPGPAGALYFCDLDTARIRSMDMSSRRITTVAGNGRPGYSGDGGPATAASLKAPHEVRFDRDGNFYIVERDNHAVRRVDCATGTISTIAGTGTAGFAGDGGPAAKALLRQPHSIAFDSAGSLLICDIGNNRIRIVDIKTGVIGTLAGTGERQRTPDDAPLEGTPLNEPRSMDTDAAGNIFVVLRAGNAVFKINQQAKRITRIAGTGETGLRDGDARQATFSGPKGIACTPEGDLWIADTENHVIRVFRAQTREVSTLIGTGERGDGPDGEPRQCKLNRPHGVFLHRGLVYVGDSENHRIRVLG